MYVCTECGLRYERGGYCGEDGGSLAASDDPLLGTEIGRYRIVRVLGQGGMGRVYLAVQSAIGSRVALKVLSEHCARDPNLLERFFAEARTVNLIRHEHIASVIDLAQLPDGRPYIIMEFVEGETLARATRGGRAPLGGIVQVVTETLSALAAAHAQQIVHRDLKPDNIIVTLKGHAKVLDFGIAKLSPESQHPLSPRTRTGALLGTPAYMAPEQINGANVDARTDIYAAGVVLFEAITGAVPFTGATAFDLMRAQLEDAPPSVRACRPEVPEALEQVITRALAKSPADRFQTAAEMGEALDTAATRLSGDQLRTLSRERASRVSLLPFAPRPTPTTERSNTPPAFSAVNLPKESSKPEVITERGQTNAASQEVTERGRTNAASRASGPGSSVPWGWIGGAVGLAGLAVAVTVIVMSRPPESPRVAAATPTPTPATAPSSTPAMTRQLAETPSNPAPIAPATPAPATPAPATARKPPRPPLVERPRPTATATTPPPAQAETDDDIARAALAKKWNRHPQHVALPHEHPIARRPRVLAAPSYDATDVDYRKVVAHALAAARKELPDAHLVSITVHLEDGRSNLTSTARYTLAFELKSNERVDGACTINVEYGPRQAEVYFDSNDMFCTSKAIRVPTCSTATTWERAGRPGAGTTEVIRLEFDGQSWEIGPDRLRVPDDC